MKRMGRMWSITLICQDCGKGYLLQLGELHHLSLRSVIEEQIIAAETHHESECPARTPY
jgi:hypothetical protein